MSFIDEVKAIYESKVNEARERKWDDQGKIGSNMCLSIEV